MTLRKPKSGQLEVKSTVTSKNDEYPVSGIRAELTGGRSVFDTAGERKELKGELGRVGGIRLGR